MVTEQKDVLKDYLQGARDVLLWKLEGLSERDLRLPRTPTGTNLLGLVKHALNTEVIYFGPTFGREWPTPGELVSADDPDPLAGWYATETETAAGIVDLYRRVQAFADVTIDALPLDATGHVDHWGGTEVSLTRSWSTRPSTCSVTLAMPTSSESRSTAPWARCPATAISPTPDWPAHLQRLTAITDSTDPDWLQGGQTPGLS